MRCSGPRPPERVFSAPRMSKKLISRVRPGVRETRASDLRAARALSAEDLPTLLRPQKANSSGPAGGQPAALAADFTNSAERTITGQRPCSRGLPDQDGQLRLAGRAIGAPVVDPLHRFLRVEWLERRRLPAVARQAALGRRIDQAEQARQLLVAHHHRGLVEAPSTVAGLTGHALHVRLAGALLVPRVAL